jgi:hypothetical protein
VQNLTNEEQVVVIQARTVLTLAEKVTGTKQTMGRRLGSAQRKYNSWEQGLWDFSCLLGKTDTHRSSQPTLHLCKEQIQPDIAPASSQGRETV